MVKILQSLPFQSSPAPKDGRYLPRRGSIPSRCSFNPRPPRRTGATSVRDSVGASVWVSILARPEGRALLQALLFVSETYSFNPRPPRRTGATPIAIHLSLNSAVSILARPEGRALLLMRVSHLILMQCFNPRPPRRTGATVRIK